MNDQSSSITQVLSKSFWVLMPACIVLPLAYAFPKVSLDGVLGILAYGIAQSGGYYGIPVLAIFFIHVLVHREGVTRSRQRQEVFSIAAAILLFLGGLSIVNEHLTKPFFSVPRPNIVELADSADLSMTAEEFYTLPDKPSRTAYLKSVLTEQTADRIRIHDLVRHHWIKETGYSFPSGHAIATMMFTTVMLTMGLSCLSGPRVFLFYLLVPWAILVCYSRPVLRVHSAIDITAGAMLGIVCGCLAFIIIRVLLDRSQAVGENL